jgi:trigger factor
MVGMAIGETKDLTVKFPEQYHAADLAGKDAVFTVTVNKIEAEQLPELNDEFAKNVSKFDTVAEYKADIEKNLKESKERQANMENENAVIEAVTANASVEIPRCMIESQLDYLMQDMEYRLQYMYRMKLEDYLKYTGGTIEELRKSRETDAERDVKTRLVLEAIVKAENLDVTEDDVTAEITRLCENNGKDVEDYKKHIDAKQLNYMKNHLLTKKLIAFLKENNVFEVKVAEKKTTKKSTKKTTKTEEDK